ncbi:MAG TPA: hypothetical protein VF118_00680 [Gemmatimonadaceae bacterium]
MILSAALFHHGPPDVSLQLAASEGMLMLVVAFVSLIAARRRALYVVWGILLILWTLLLVQRPGPWGSPSAFAIPPLFARWTVSAMPLAIIAALGTPDSLPGGRRRHAVVLPLISAAWLLLAIVGRHYGYMNVDVGAPGAPYRAVRIAAWCVWAPVPFALAAWSVLGWCRVAKGQATILSDAAPVE